jgi:hypothetical protein
MCAGAARLIHFRSGARPGAPGRRGSHVTHRWREMDSNFRFRARRLRHFLPRSKPGLSADCNHSVGIDSGDRVLPTFGDLGGAVGPTDHPMGRRVRPQCDQIQPAGSGIQASREFARGLRREPYRPARDRHRAPQPPRGGAALSRTRRSGLGPSPTQADRRLESVFLQQRLRRAGTGRFYLPRLSAVVQRPPPAVRPRVR